ncbi:uncharacterized protein [Chelonus insularis]|uniref:uncharacterized protein n=1 Tax=Chelonus insularis TaxID=460826 RepID=UPI00158B8D74|nr:uncharacterized protein LOC118064580 [Chelonus insularis]
MSDLGPRQYRNRLNQLFPRNDNDDLEAINAPNEGLPEPSSDTLTNNEDQNRHFNMVFSSDPAPELEAENIMEMLLNDHNVNDHVLVGELLDIHGDELINEDVEEGGILFEVPLKSNNESSDEDGIKEEQARRNFNLNENMPLYLGADITVKESMLSILSLFLKHNLPMTTIEDIIAIIGMHCLKSGLIRNSVYKFQKFFNLTECNYKKHYYCSFCQKQLKNENQECDSCHTQKTSHFIEIPIIRHMQTMFARQNFFESLQMRFERRNGNNLICDIYDGKLYKDAYDSGFLSNRNNISFTWYTDGIPVFKSSKISAWPIYLTINELPFEERKKRYNTLILGLWFGEISINLYIVFEKFLKKFYLGSKLNFPIEIKLL